MLKIRGPREDWDAAMLSAKHFVENYPDRMGVRDGVGYFRSGVKVYVYRTKTQVTAWISEYRVST